MKRVIALVSVLGVLIGLTLVLSGCKSEAKSYPSKSISIVYHAKAGSGGDIFLRNLGKALEKQLKQPIVIENRPGGGGATAWGYVAKAKPDGYTLLGISSTIITGPLQTPMDVNYKSFKPIAQVFYDPTVIFTSSKSEFRSFKEIIEYAKAHPKEMKWGAGSPGSAESLTLKYIMNQVGAEIQVVPFEGGGDVAVEVMAGRLAAGIGEYAEIAHLVKSGDLKILVGLGSERIPGLPDVPTLKEEGVDFVFEKVRGLMAPKDTPDYVVQKLVDAIKKVYDDAEFKKYYTESNIIPLFRGPEELSKVLDQQNEFFKSMINK
ncbi:MAG TPA: tripartite tricarboxylate transporter substrate binding protein [Firmicutes bacterium]|nr:tripartite tricarboxylate transporter substrate binding protein [Candidatus Fermentithermobacillaceae bacterium]